MDCSLPGSSVHGILQARLEWVARPSSKRSSRPRDQTSVSCGSCTAARFFTAEPPGKPQKYVYIIIEENNKHKVFSSFLFSRPPTQSSPVYFHRLPLSPTTLKKLNLSGYFPSTVFYLYTYFFNPNLFSSYFSQTWEQVFPP